MKTNSSTQDIAARAANPAYNPLLYAEATHRPDEIELAAAGMVDEDPLHAPPEPDWRVVLAR